MIDRLHPSTHWRIRKNFVGFIILPIVFTVPQIYGAFRLKHYFFHDAVDQMLELPTRTIETTESAKVSNDRSLLFPPITRKKINETVGSCLMVKEDNELLYEWLAYHYTILPLRHVYVASDVGNQQDPSEVLRKWKLANTDLEYWVQNATDFVHRHGHAYGEVKTIEDVHHAFVHRQRAFITTCTEFLKSKGLNWITYFDTDEFLVMNRLNQEEESGMREGDAERIELRKRLPSLRSNITFLETIHGLESTHNLGNCQTLPRVLVGALENISCPASPPRESIESQGIPYDWMSSLRFHQHAKKGDFGMSKYGKVIMKVSGFSEQTLAKVPSNIHRPYKDECGAAFTLFPNALFYLNHYIGSWERYNSREDGRRNRDEWEKRAYINADSSCENEIFRWIYHFQDLVGMERSAYLLGRNQAIGD